MKKSNQPNNFHRYNHEPIKTNINVYLGGRISRLDWRLDIVDGLRDVIRGDDYKLPELWPILKNSIQEKHHYIGPFFYNLRHSFMHGISWYGEEEKDCGLSCYDVQTLRMKKIFDLNLQAIHDADLFFAWINDYNALGTIAEIVEAEKSGKHVVVALGHDLYKNYSDAEGQEEAFYASNNEYWYACQYADRIMYDCHSAADALDEAITFYLRGLYPFKIIVSKYVNKCRGCKQNIEVGSNVYWCVRETLTGVYCLECEDKVKDIGYVLED